jgi:hypothetical protein
MTEYLLKGIVLFILCGVFAFIPSEITNYGLQIFFALASICSGIGAIFNLVVALA